MKDYIIYKETLTMQLRQCSRKWPNLTLINCHDMCPIYNSPGRRNRHDLTTEEKSLLMSEFSRSPYATCEIKRYLSTKLGMSTHQICCWFDHRRYFIRSLETQVNWEGG